MRHPKSVEPSRTGADFTRRDGKVFTDASDSSDVSEAWEFDLHEDDPWNANVVLGLRVYSKGDVKITVVKGDEGERAHRGRMSL